MNRLQKALPSGDKGSESLAQRSKKNSQDLLEPLPEAHLVTNRSGIIIGASRIAAEMLSTQHNKLAGRPLDLFVPANLRPHCVENLRRVINGKQVPEWAISLKRSGSRALRAKVRLSGIPGRDGEIVAVGWTLRPSSALGWNDPPGGRVAAPSRRLADDEMNITTVGMVGLDANGYVAWMNRPFGKFFRVAESDLIGRDYLESIGDQIRGVTFDPPDSMARAAAGEEFECRIVELRTGQERWLKHSTVRASHRFGDVKTFEIFRDITPDKLVQERLKEGVRAGALGVELGELLTGGGGLSRILGKAARVLGDRLHLLAVRIWLLDPKTRRLERAASFGEDLDSKAHPVIAGRGRRKKRPAPGSELFPLSASQVEWAAERGLIWHRQSISLDGLMLGTIMVLASHSLMPRSREALHSASDALALWIRKDRAERQVHLSRWKLSRLSAELRALAERLMSAQEEERRYLSRELHDDLNQKLAIAVVEVESLCQQPGRLPSAARESLDGLRTTLAGLSDHVRRMAYHLHPSILDDLGLAAALKFYTEEFSRREKILVDFQVLGTDREIPKEVASCLYRVAQESLRNIARHAQAPSAQVRLVISKQRAQLSVRDNGVGFRAKPPGARGSGLGFVSMRERVRMVKGRFVVRSRPGRGTYVFASVPRTSSP